MTSREMVFVYDANVMPISFDVCWALTWADQIRAKKNLKSIHAVIINLSAGFVHSRPPGHPDFVSTEELRWRVREVVVAAALLHRSVSTVTLCEPGSASAQEFSAIGAGAIHPPAIPRIYREVLGARQPLAGFAADETERVAVDGFIGYLPRSKLVSITIRDNGNGSKRDSRIDQWNEFAVMIAREGYTPVFVPDTSGWHEDGKFSGACMPQAALNLGLRMALYESSLVNLFVSSGPAALCYLTPGIPYLCFKITTPGEHLASEGVLSELGFEIGGQPGFASGQQKWVWADDSCKNIYREFSSFAAGIA